MKIKISPSILACDFSRLGEEIVDMHSAGADMIHLDVMDGHFVPNISFGAPIIASVREKTSIYFDTHLMITDPRKYASDFAKAGSDRITFHIESDSNPIDVIDTIKKHGIDAGISLKPATGIEDILSLLPDLKQVLIMTVEPGFGGQSFMDEMCEKILKLAKYRQENNLQFDIQVDGGINLSTASKVSSHGANVLVAGSALFSKPNYQMALDELRSVADEGLANRLF